ncbi:Dynamin-1-like protein [Orchesella cincta]|uniref:Dynamin-1-like protein n=1 Tax=Orchesella cincta TaxID=48709 RepID=A0A1D2N779_ORCCI|nr:Dynamin-1-like protein [Orchesella cincta]
MPASRDPFPIDGDSKMEGLIPIFNTIQDILERTKTGQDSIEIRLPQIVVIGSQSSGKSSVLENLVGQPFLPYGTGIVTRCSGTVCEFDHVDREFTDFKEVEREIISRTAEIAGTNSGISRKSIKITIKSPNVLTLTVVDLPGLVQVPVGDQPENIADQVKELILEYTSSENAVILAVCDGTVDIANHESIRIAKQVDPYQERTIVLLTKLDKLVPAEEYVKTTEILNGDVVPIKLGLVGVINRSHEDVQRNKPIAEVMEFEKKFLREHFGTICHKHGIANLARKLNRILLQRILATCSGLTTQIRSLTTATEAQLKALGHDGDISEGEKREILFSIIDRFSKEYEAQIDGMKRSGMKSSPLTSGARIDFIINSTLQADLDSTKPLAGLNDYEILIALRNSAAVVSRIVTPERALNHFIKEEIKGMAVVADHCSKLLHQEMVDMISKCLEGNKRFPKVNAAITSIVEELLSSKMEITSEILDTYFEIQSSSAFTASPTYHVIFKELMTPVSGVDLGLLPVPMVLEGNGEPVCNLSRSTSFKPTGSTNCSSTQSEFCEKLRTLANHVIQTVRWQVQDFITKAVLNTLVYKTVDNVGTELNKRLTESEDIVDRLIKEPDEIHNRRVQLKQNILEYNDALKLLDELRSAAC